MLALGVSIAGIVAPIGAMFAGNKLDKQIADMSTLLADASIKGDAFAVMMNDAASAAATRRRPLLGVDPRA